MSDNLKRKRPEDATKINVNQRWELEYWSRKLGASKEKLKQAVKAVGPSALLVKVRLGLSKLGK
jgi:hypothetical protein